MQLRGSGRMWVAPRAEFDPSAVLVRAEGQDLGVEALARRYLPDGMAPPPGMVVGRASLAATMQASVAGGGVRGWLHSRGCGLACKTAV